MRVRRKGSERRKGSRTFVNVQKVSRGKANKNMQMEGNSEGEEVWLGCTSDLKREGKVRVVAGLGWAGLGWAGLLFTCFRKGRGSNLERVLTRDLGKKTDTLQPATGAMAMPLSCAIYYLGSTAFKRRLCTPAYCLYRQNKLDEALDALKG
ncbi:hypothetical protein Lal_00013874 [Lupinus albus]|nr:hypothetical protein Lal_00042398 [Lupinus albus]KAF1855618.1 hypothetical protein Lal_00013874 [Lupinus albus]